MKQPAISDAEWEVMNVVWANSPVTASDIVEALSDHTDWSPRTIKTMLNRLLKKGALSHEVDGKRYLYRPAISREQGIEQASETFLSRVFSGDEVPMLVHLVRNAELTPRQIEKLREALQEKEEER